MFLSSATRQDESCISPESAISFLSELVEAAVSPSLPPPSFHTRRFMSRSRLKSRGNDNSAFFVFSRFACTRALRRRGSAYTLTRYVVSCRVLGIRAEVVAAVEFLEFLGRHINGVAVSINSSEHYSEEYFLILSENTRGREGSSVR